MYVCICRAVNRAGIEAAIDGGACSVDDVEAACGAGGDCGTCREEISEIISETQLVRRAGCPRSSSGRDITAPRAA